MLKDQIDLAGLQVLAENWTKKLVGEFFDTWDGGLSDGGDRGVYDEAGRVEVEGADYSEEGGSVTAETSQERDLQSQDRR